MDLRLDHYIKGLLPKTKLEVLKADPLTLEAAMNTAARTKNIYQGVAYVPSYNSYMAEQASL